MTGIPSSVVMTLAGSFFINVVNICVPVGLQFGSNLQHDLKTSSILRHWVFRSPSYFGS